MATALVPMYLANRLISVATCTASSLVGASIRACTGPFALILCNIGRPKAAVLPVPVCACPTTSLPSKTSGIAASCIGNGVSNPFSESAFVNCALNPNSSKVFAICFFHLLFCCFSVVCNYYKSHGRYEKFLRALFHAHLTNPPYILCLF